MDKIILSIAHGIITGIGGAALVDAKAFFDWKSWDDCATFSVKLASFRWFQGAVGGALMGAGLGWVLK